MVYIKIDAVTEGCFRFFSQEKRSSSPQSGALNEGGGGLAAWGRVVREICFQETTV